MGEGVGLIIMFVGWFCFLQLWDTHEVIRTFQVGYQESKDSKTKSALIFQFYRMEWFQ